MRKRYKYSDIQQFLMRHYVSTSWDGYREIIVPMHFIHLIDMTKSQARTFCDMTSDEQEEYLQNNNHIITTFASDILNIDPAGVGNHPIASITMRHLLEFALSLENFNWLGGKND